MDSPRERIDMFTEEEFAACFDVELRAVRLWRSKGDSPDYSRIGRQIFYKVADVEAWVEAKKTSCGSSV